jgi:hypothetical protein
MQYNNYRHSDAIMYSFMWKKNSIVTNPYTHVSGCIVKPAKALLVISFSQKLDPISFLNFLL